MPRPHLYLLVALLVSGGVWYFSDHIDPYHLDVLIGVGVNIILAVSLNLVNGYTGQFSLGHAGFMAVGAYASAAITNLLGPTIIPLIGGVGSFWSHLFFCIVVLGCGGLAAAVIGLCVGVPSLRLKGDYLAIVTLGFGEIIRVIIQNMDSVGASRG